jgi:hypothetical protein
MNLTPQEIRKRIESYLRVLYPRSTGVVEITLLIKDEAKDAWKVNIRFKREYGAGTSTDALLLIDANGDVTQFKEGWGWRY